MIIIVILLSIKKNTLFFQLILFVLLFVANILFVLVFWNITFHNNQVLIQGVDHIQVNLTYFINQL